MIGVMPEGFHFPAAETALWVPVPIDPAKPPGRGASTSAAVGRLRPGATAEQAVRELSGLVWRIPENGGRGRGSPAA